MVFLWLVRIVGKSLIEGRVMTVGRHDERLPGALKTKSCGKVDSGLLDIKYIFDVMELEAKMKLNELKELKLVETSRGRRWRGEAADWTHAQDDLHSYLEWKAGVNRLDSANIPGTLGTTRILENLENC